MIDADRLDELATWAVDDDTPDDAKVRIPAGDLRDLVALIPVVRAAMAWRALAPMAEHPDQVDALLIVAVDELRAKGAE